MATDRVEGRKTSRTGGMKLFAFLLAWLTTSHVFGATGTLTWIGPTSGGSWDDSANWSSDYSTGTFSDWLTGSGYSTTFNFSSLADGANITTATAKIRITGITLPSTAGVWTFTGTGNATAVFGTNISSPLEVSVPSGGKVVWRIKVPVDTSDATDCGFNLRGGGSFCIDTEFSPYNKKPNIRAYDGTIIIGANAVSTYSSGFIYAGISLIDNKGKLTLERDLELGTLWATPGHASQIINLNGHALNLHKSSNLSSTVQGGGTITFGSNNKTAVQSPLSGATFYHAYSGYVTNEVAFPSEGVIGASMGGEIILKGNQPVAGLCGTGMSSRIYVPANSVLTAAPAAGKTYQYQGRLEGPGGFAVNGAADSIQTLSGFNSYAGATAVNAGTLEVSGPNSDVVFWLPFDGKDNATYLAERVSGLIILGPQNGIPVSVASAPDGIFGKGIRFNNAACWKIDVDGYRYYRLGSEISISVWVKPTSAGAAGNGCIFHAGDGWNAAKGNYDLIWLRLGRNSGGADPAKRSFSATQLTGTLPGNATFDDGNWHHICFTQGGRTRKLYLDGQLAAEAQTSEDVSTTWDNSCIGAVRSATVSANGSAYDGDMDEFMIANRVWSAAEVAAVARGRMPRQAVTTFMEKLPRPLAHWAFDDPSDIGKDSSGNGHTLTVAAGSPSIASTAKGARGKYLNLSGGASLKLASYPSDFPSGKPRFTVAARFVYKGSGTSDTYSKSAVVGWGDFTTDCKAFCLGVYRPNSKAPFLAYASWKSKTEASFADKSGVITYNGSEHYAWVTYVCVHDGDVVRFYRDGVLQTLTTWQASDTDIADNGDFWVGYRPSTGKYFNGAIDDIRLYGDVLTDEEVRLLTLDMKADGSFVSTLPPMTDVSVASGAKVVFRGEAQAAHSLSGSGEVSIAPYASLTVGGGSTFSGTLTGLGTICLTSGVTTVSGDLSDWRGLFLLDGGRLAFPGSAAGSDVAIAENTVWTSDKNGSGFPVVTGAGKIELPETLTLSFPDGLRSSCANLVLASGTSVVAPSSFAGWTLDAPSTPATGIKCQVNGGVVSVRVLGLGGMKIIFR